MNAWDMDPKGYRPLYQAVTERLIAARERRRELREARTRDDENRVPADGSVA